MTYTIQPGDQIAVHVYGDSNLSQSTVVGPDGAIQYPLAGRIAVGGVTPAQASKKLTSAFAKYLRNPEVTVTVQQHGQQRVLVMGNVVNPGSYSVAFGAHLSDAIAAAGGVGRTNGNLPDARVTQPDGSVQKVSLQQLLPGNDKASDIPVANGAVVYVPGPNAFTVAVVGAVDKPGNVELHEGDRLSMAVARAGSGPGALSELDKIVVTRLDEHGTPHVFRINLYQALQHGDDRYDPVMIPGDTVYVPQGKRPPNGSINPNTLVNRLTNH